MTMAFKRRSLPAAPLMPIYVMEEAPNEATDLDHHFRGR